MLITKVKSVFLSNKYNLKNFFSYILSDGLSQALPFLILPLIAAKLGPSNFGRVANFTVLIQLYHVIIGMRIVFYYSSEYHSSSKAEKTQLISAILNIYLSLTLLVVLGTLFFGAPLSTYLSLEKKWQFLAIVIALLLLVGQLFTSHLRMEEKAKRFGIIMFTRACISALGSYLFVIVFELSYPGRFLAVSFSALYLGYSSIRYFYRFDFIKVKWEPEVQKKLVSFGLPLLPYALSPWLKNGLEKVLITNQLGLTENGIFALALTFSGAFGMISMAFLNTFTPQLYKRLSNENNNRQNESRMTLVKQIIFFVLIFACVLIIGFYVVVLLFNLFLDEEYQKALRYMPILLVVTGLSAMTNLFKAIIVFKKKTQALGIIGLLVVLIQVPITFWFIRKFGVFGAPYSSLIGSLLLLGSYAFLSQRYFPLPWVRFFVRRK